MQSYFNYRAIKFRVESGFSQVEIRTYIFLPKIDETTLNTLDYC